MSNAILQLKKKVDEMEQFTTQGTREAKRSLTMLKQISKELDKLIKLTR